MSCHDCNDTPLPLANCNDGCEECGPTNAIGLPDCPPSSEPCETILNASCVKYTGPNLPTLGITNGMRLKAALVALNFKLLNNAGVSKNHTITVTQQQSKTTVEYINKVGAASVAVVTKDNSPQTICALIGTPVVISGSGTVTVTNTIC